MQGVRIPHARLFARLSGACAALALAAGLALPAQPAEAAPGGSIGMNPPNASLAAGDTVSVTFDVSAGIDIHRVHFGLQYNASVLQVVDADAGTSGTQILPGPFPGTDTEGAATQNNVSAGIINYQYELNASNEVSGTGTVATVQFLAIANGNANLSFSARQFADGSDVTSTPSASPAIIVVGGAAPTVTPGPSLTPFPSVTPAPTTTAVPPTATAAASSATPTRTPTRTATPASSATAVASPTRTPTPTQTPKITVLQDSNATPTGGAAGNTTGPVDPPSSTEANQLPGTGGNDPPIEWWKWTFFGAALMLAFAGWFFTFAVHYSDRDPVLMDRYEANRRKYGKRR